MTGVSLGQVRKFLGEPSRSEFFTGCLQEARASFQTLWIESADLYAKKNLVQYAAIRAFQRQIIVETGVANGVSSTHLLLTLQMNNRGTLYSVTSRSIFQPANLWAGSFPKSYAFAANFASVIREKYCRDFWPTSAQLKCSFTMAFTRMHTCCESIGLPIRICALTAF